MVIFTLLSFSCDLTLYITYEKIIFFKNSWKVDFQVVTMSEVALVLKPNIVPGNRHFATQSLNTFYSITTARHCSVPSAYCSTVGVLVKQAMPLQLMEGHGGQDIHTTACGGSHAGMGWGTRVCDPMESPCWSKSQPVIPSKGDHTSCWNHHREHNTTPRYFHYRLILYALFP